MIKTALALFLVLCGFQPLPDCGGEYRWDYKTLVDATGWPHLTDKAKRKAIHGLVQLQRPATLGAQRTPYEKRKVTVTAWLVMLGKEDDEDYHLVLTNDDRTDSLIAEIPDPDCKKIKLFPALKTAYTKARSMVDEQVQEPGSSVKELDAPVKVKVTGMLFFDKIAHGKGHARNGIEIHPITAIAIVNRQ